jgi:hypothetical protein
MLSASARLSQLFDLIARTLESRLPQDVPNWRDTLPPKSCIYQKENEVLDAHVCLKILGLAPAFEEATKGMRPAIKQLEQIRNRWAHQEPVSQADVEVAISTIAGFMDALGERVARDAATAFRSENFEFSNSIRRILQRRAKAGCETITYGKACDLLKLSNSEDRNQLYRQLTALGILQKANGEPQLCSLVVLGEDDQGVSEVYPAGMPGRGYYWLIGLDPRAPTGERKARWYREVAALKSVWMP